MAHVLARCHKTYGRFSTPRFSRSHNLYNLDGKCHLSIVLESLGSQLSIDGFKMFPRYPNSELQPFELR